MTCITVTNQIVLHIKEDKMCDCLSLTSLMQVNNY